VLIWDADMPRVIGIDPGSLSFDLFGFHRGYIFLDTSIPSDRAAKDVRVLGDLIQASGPVDLIVGPSGYGLPLTAAEDIGEREMFLMTLVQADERKHIPVLAAIEMLTKLAQNEKLPLWFTPAVAHLPTVPQWRKINKIDMGTADKLNCAVLAIYDQARTYRINYAETGFVLVEIGGAYTSVLAVDNGQVVDGIGGSVGAPGFLSGGALDGELAYLLGPIKKKTLFQGGILDVAGQGQLTPGEFASRLDEPDLNRAWLVLEEAVYKLVAAQLALVPGVKEIILSGRLTREPLLTTRLKRRLRILKPVRTVSSLARTAKEAAQGAALLGVGLAGGETALLIEQLRIKEAAGTVFDYIIPWGTDLRRRYQV
jgi:predicted butyrate kinase (DUF1464 family)